MNNRSVAVSVLKLWFVRNTPYVAVQITSTTQNNYETEKREEIRTEKRMRDEREYDKLLLIFITQNTESENTFIPLD